jgi:hypothetical protein
MTSHAGRGIYERRRINIRDDNVYESTRCAASPEFAALFSTQNVFSASASSLIPVSKGDML